ncbi:toll/interleukin-1 receptor domain-containing protein [Curtobacterium flaccumfaciens pv. flaccumfaciens]|uniref:toll/interleukin-1 receptor domain-containing protein n=1 Tax=Curtobacterium flaccumfaciens TaxID=2035 RepID=UPI00217D91CF|nr:toll/interleukin-1 receptor domain-containing protein [Curtobacterium flaccumfaciens]MCS6568137.1 toll/interleukin-1 receptor domain-containing protein [Curtobacterium flaccumfaciens pv. flaccumfaciens]MCS6584239.1 toll/interleukin-1 receptor domain-containing protein [Curtobacterium flaccumfaciens pv. flaccumfaciens]
MTDSQGFWSYVRKDDDADGSRVTQLARDVVAQYEMLSNESIELFLDVDEGIQWGDDWEKKLADSIGKVAFFIPVLTPRYFASASCRAELNTFARTATELGFRNLLLPLLYVDVPGLHDDAPSDPLLSLAKRFQWVDWRDLRFADRASADYRRAISALAERLVAANREAEASTASDDVISRAEAREDEAGVLDLLAKMEESFPDLNQTTTEIGEAVEEIGAQTQAASDELQANASAQPSFAKRLIILRSLAANLSGPSSRILRKGQDFARLLLDVDLGVRAIIARAPEEPESRQDFCEFFTQIRGMVAASERGLGGLESMVESAAPLEGLSKDLRAPLRDMRQGVTAMVEGREVMRKWLTLIDESGIDCNLT